MVIHVVSLEYSGMMLADNFGVTFNGDSVFCAVVLPWSLWPKTNDKDKFGCSV